MNTEERIARWQKNLSELKTPGLLRGLPYHEQAARIEQLFDDAEALDADCDVPHYMEDCDDFLCWCPQPIDYESYAYMLYEYNDDGEAPEAIEPPEYD